MLHYNQHVGLSHFTSTTRRLNKATELEQLQAAGSVGGEEEKRLRDAVEAAAKEAELLSGDLQLLKEFAESLKVTIRHPDGRTTVAEARCVLCLLLRSCCARVCLIPPARCRLARTLMITLCC